MTTSGALPPSGWYSDPWRIASWRWWDGNGWTGYTDHWYGSTTFAFPAPTAATLDESRPIRAGWLALGGVVAGIVLSVGVYLLFASLGVATSNPLVALVAQLGLWTGLLGACVIAVRKHGSGSLRDLGFRVRWVALALGLGFGVATLIGVSVIAALLLALGIEPHRSSLVDPLQRGPLTVVVIVFIAVIGAPFVEELFFRGLVMSGLVSRWGAPIGIIAQAVLFGLVHLGPTDARGNLGVFLIIAPVGAVLGILRFGFKRLGTGMFTHAVYNAIIVTIALTR